MLEQKKVAAGKLPKVRQTAYVVARAQKVAALGRVLDLEMPTLALVFCRTRTEVDGLVESLGGRGYQAEALHGGMTQAQRDRVMKRTRAGTLDLLIATDVAARGLDIEQLSHVINFDVPESPAAYVHRIGRTGRAGREGVAITLTEPREHRMLRSIEQVTGQKIEITQMPTAFDVRAKRLEVTRASIREAILGDGLEGYRVVVESLAGEFDVMDIAAAAVQLAHEATAGPAEEEVELPMAAPTPERSARPKARRTAGMARIFIGAGRKANMRPADLVGAIVNEAGIDAAAIGVIEIADAFSLVELAEEAVDPVVAALRATKIKGKRLTVRRDQANRRSP